MKEPDVTLDDETQERACWVAFSQIAQMGPVRVRRLHEHFGSLIDAWKASSNQLAQVLDARSAGNVISARSGVSPASVLERVERMGISIVTLIDEQYPRLLTQIPASPAVLYVKGTLDARDETAVAIVGTRRATAYGREFAGEIAGELAAAGVTIVSGLARGIDGFAHQGALSGGGRTVAVLASGVDIIYPFEHHNLAERIQESGALISDYPPGTKPDAPNFPTRNRIISGMALATLVVEAPRRSGALITVDFAADQGRDVFVVPGNIGSPASEGSNRLLRDGARVVTSAADILEDLGLAALAAEQPRDGTADLTDSERRLVAVMPQNPTHLDEIVVAAGLQTSQGAAMMTMLELRGIVKNVGSQHYVVVRTSAARKS